LLDHAVADAGGRGDLPLARVDALLGEQMADASRIRAWICSALRARALIDVQPFLLANHQDRHDPTV
jgi:hypothetical protein